MRPKITGNHTRNDGVAMKILFKYSILAVLAICLNFEIAEAWSMYANELSSAAGQPIAAGQQFIAHRTPTTRQAITKFYEHCPTMSCDLVHHSQDVPAAKYILRAIHSYGKTSPEQDILHKGNSNPSLLYLSDPISYYVFGLRKIVI